jgi:hypothetical protein
MKKIIKKILTGILVYAVIWGVIFAACFLIDKMIGDATTGTVLQAVKYAGYPLLGIGWVIGMVGVGVIYLIGKIAVGAIWLVKATYPFNLYFPGIPLALYALYRIAKHLINAPGPTQEEAEAEQRHAESMRVVRAGMMLRTLSDMNKK